MSISNITLGMGVIINGHKTIPRWTAFHTCKWKRYFPFLMHDHIALIPLFKIVKRTSALRMARMQRQHFISEFGRYSTPGHGTITQPPLDSVGMQPHREKPLATNLMDLLWSQLGTAECISITDGRGPIGVDLLQIFNMNSSGWQRSNQWKSLIIC